MDTHETIALVALLVAAQTGRALLAVVSRRRPEYGEQPAEDSRAPEA